MKFCNILPLSAVIYYEGFLRQIVKVKRYFAAVIKYFRFVSGYIKKSYREGGKSDGSCKLNEEKH